MSAQIKAEFPKKLQFLFRTKRYKGAYGGRGCIHGDTLLETPNGKIKVSNFKGGDIFAFDGKRIVKTYAGKPIIYNPEMLYTVVFSDGSQIKTTAKHKFLTVNGWEECSSLRVGDLIPLPPNELPLDLQQICYDACPSMLFEGVRHYLQILAGFLWCYFEGYHQCDAQPHSDVKTVLDVSQQLVYAQQHNHHALMREGVQGCEYKNILLRPSLHLANLAYLLSKVAQSFEVQESCSDDIISELTSVTSQLLLLSHERNNLESQAQGLALVMVRLGNLSCLPESLQKVFDIVRLDFGDSSYSSHVVCKHNLSITKTIVEIKPFKVCEFYDLFVPFFNNYIAEGVVNHNSGKSWSFARALLIKGAQTPLRILCAREVQKSIKQSVHKLLSDQIYAMGLSFFYEILETEIRGRNGTEISFSGLATHTVDSIKSYEGCDICWVEEAHAVSKKSWDVLIPTIRKPGSEIWLTFNPELNTDETYVRFVLNPPADSVIVHMNYTDNPWFPDVLEKERLHCKVVDPKGYANIWEGKCKPAVEGAIYYDEMQAVEVQRRICNVPYDPLMKVHVIFDLGWNDAMAISLVQRSSSEIRVIEYIEDSHKALDYYSSLLKNKNLNWGKLWLPHDGRHKSIQTGKSAQEIMEALGWQVEITPNMSIEDGIKLTRMTFGRIYFDKEKTKRLIECAKRYRRQINQATNEAGPPLHDEFSHGADNLRYICVNAESLVDRPAVSLPKRNHVGSHGWMG